MKDKLGKNERKVKKEKKKISHWLVKRIKINYGGQIFIYAFRLFSAVLWKPLDSTQIR